jgi:hypothetical protein
MDSSKDEGAKQGFARLMSSSSQVAVSSVRASGAEGAKRPRSPDLGKRGRVFSMVARMGPKVIFGPSRVIVPRTNLAGSSMGGLGDGFVIEIGIKIVVGRAVTGQFRLLDLLVIGVDDGVLDTLATGGVDGVGDVGVELGSAIHIAGRSFFIEASATLIAIAGSQMILVATMRTAISQLSTGHGDKEAFGPFNDFEISNDKRVVEGDTAERMEPFVVLFDQFDSDFRDFHCRLLWL